MTDDLQQLHDQKNEAFVERLHTSLFAMCGGVCDSGQTVAKDAGAAFELPDAAGEADAGSDPEPDQGPIA